MANEVEFTDYQQIVSAWINSKWPANNACPMCHVEAPGWHLESPVDLTVHPESTAASFVYQMTAVPANGAAYLFELWLCSARQLNHNRDQANNSGR